MNKIIACIDFSNYAEKVCELVIAIAQKSNCKVKLLHVAEPHSEMKANSNLSGSIGLGAKTDILHQLTEEDEKHGKIEQQKGFEILEKAKQILEKNNIKNIELVHLRGDFIETIITLQEDVDIFVVGKCGEKSEKKQSQKLGENLENISRRLNKPILVATKSVKKNLNKFLLSYDASKASKEALFYIPENKIFKNMECNLLKICEEKVRADEVLEDAENFLRNAGVSVKTFLQKGGKIEKIISDHIKSEDIDLMIIGAYGHSKIRSFFFGSTTTALLEEAKIPVLLFH